MPDAMNFRHSVTMATLPTKTITKAESSLMGRKAVKMRSKWDITTKMIAVINFMNCSTSKLPIWRKRRHLLGRNGAWYMRQETSPRHHISNKYDHQNLFQHYIVINYPPLSLIFYFHKSERIHKIFYEWQVTVWMPWSHLNWL